jgi:hypothetical protein
VLKLYSLALALDPAIPLFDVASPENRTDPSDAVFVDAIHTSANGIIGVWEAIGHIDFYPNGGRSVQKFKQYL